EAPRARARGRRAPPGRREPPGASPDARAGAAGARRRHRGARLSPMRRPALLGMLALCAPAGADPLPAHAPRIADYDIRVKLDADANTLAGSEHITWRNPASEPVGDLWFHLYLNAFKNSESTFFRESGGQLRGDQMPD